MDDSFFKAFGTVVGLLVGGPLLYMMFRFGITYGTLLSDVSEAKATGVRTELAVGSIGSRVQTIEQTLHGPDGTNGLYSDVRAIKKQLADAA